MMAFPPNDVPLTIEGKSSIHIRRKNRRKIDLYGSILAMLRGVWPDRP
jgi:hypothetical protein